MLSGFDVDSKNFHGYVSCVIYHQRVVQAPAQGSETVRQLGNGARRPIIQRVKHNLSVQTGNSHGLPVGRNGDWIQTTKAHILGRDCPRRTAIHALHVVADAMAWLISREYDPLAIRCPRRTLMMDSI